MIECKITDGSGTIRCTPDVDEILRLLADSRRRRIVAVLEARDENRIRIDELRSRLNYEEVPADRWRRELYHVHLPMLDDIGLIEYDRRDGMVRYYQCELVADLLEVVDSEVPDRVR